MKREAQDVTIKRENRPWGFFIDLVTGRNYHVKLLSVKEGRRLSMQRHKYRDELWILLEGRALVYQMKDKKVVKRNIRPWSLNNFIRRMIWHRLEAGPGGAIILEISFGFFDEKDIERIDDDYEREFE